MVRFILHYLSLILCNLVVEMDGELRAGGWWDLGDGRWNGGGFHF